MVAQLATIATVSATGVVTGASAGTVIISYTYTNICGTADTTKTMTVNTLPDAGTITGPSNVCTSASMTLVDAVSGGVWGVVGSGISVTASGGVNGLTQGVDSVTYSVSNMCGTTRTGFVVNVITIPTPGIINAAASQLCVGISDTLSATPTGGTWSVANGNASLNSNIVTAAMPGTDTIYYILSNECGQATALLPITILQSAICDSGSLVKTISNTGGMSVYPNPNDGSFTVLVSSPANEPVAITITNVVGETVKQYDITTNAASIIKLSQPPGFYILSAATAQQQYMVRLVVAR